MNSALINVVITAYNCGLLQFEPMSICGFNVKLDIKKRFNVLTIEFCGMVLSANIYDQDMVCTQESSIENLINDLVHMADNK